VDGEAEFMLNAEPPAEYAILVRVFGGVILIVGNVNIAVVINAVLAVGFAPAN
jgi:hypothetical protein